jgi:uncharacterized protein GlcG (DUF336 family)
MKTTTIVLSLCLAIAPLASAQESDRPNCTGLPTATQLKSDLKNLDGVPLTIGGAGGQIGGFFNGTRVWVAVVNRSGQVCATATSSDETTQVWPGSQAMARAKAYTANSFSNDALAFSTAKLYTIAQPGHSLWNHDQSNSFDTQQIGVPTEAGNSKGRLAGDLIFLGGGVPLYDVLGKVIGGLGVSGDTSCADHEVAKRIRQLSNLNPAGGATADDISYSKPDGASAYTHPQCVATYRNGKFIGDEAAAKGY